MPVIPLFLFFLWELPAMVAMSFHKLICAVTGNSFEQQYFGVWPYRIIGLLVVWPAVFALIALISVGGAGGSVGEILLIGMTGLVVWARFSRKGS